MQKRTKVMFSKACEYGIRATIHIAGQSVQGQRVSLKDIANAIDSPVAFTAKILQLLAKSGIVNSVKGPAGGFEMEPDEMKRIRLSQIVAAIDGDKIYNGCGLGLRECSEEKPCPVHDRFKVIRDGLKGMLETTTVYELTMGLKNGSTFLKS